jgi:biotin transporter BioY
VGALAFGIAVAQLLLWALSAFSGCCASRTKTKKWSEVFFWSAVSVVVFPIVLGIIDLANIVGSQAVNTVAWETILIIVLSSFLTSVCCSLCVYHAYQFRRACT